MDLRVSGVGSVRCGKQHQKSRPIVEMMWLTSERCILKMPSPNGAWASEITTWGWHDIRPNKEGSSSAPVLDIHFHFSAWKCLAVLPVKHIWWGGLYRRQAALQKKPLFVTGRRNSYRAERSLWNVQVEIICKNTLIIAAAQQWVGTGRYEEGEGGKW